MLRGSQIEALVDLLLDREVPLYHACQLVGFRSYLRLGGIPSRALLQRRGLPFTPFRSDASDGSVAVWDKVFFNLQDFGRVFAFHPDQGWTPNCFGPILVQLRPQALREAIDVAICERSASGSGFRRDEEALSSVDAVDALFSFPDRRWKLKGRPEMSCTVPADLVPFEFVSRVTADPLRISGRRLLDVIEDDTQRHDIKLPLSERIVPEGREDDYMALQRAIENNPQITPRRLAAEGEGRIRAWAEANMKHNLGWIFDDYRNYLWTGTLNPNLPTHKRGSSSE